MCCGGSPAYYARGHFDGQFRPQWGGGQYAFPQVRSMLPACHCLSLLVIAFLCCYHVILLSNVAVTGAVIDGLQWLGKTSTTGKHQRYTSALQQHMRMAVSADRRDTRLAYIPYLRKRLNAPLTAGAGRAAPPAPSLWLSLLACRQGRH